MLAGVYLAISLVLLARMTIGSWGLRRILQGARPIPSLGPGIFESQLLVVPGSVGCFRTRILLPLAWRDWDAATLRAVIAHERAHIQRWDWLIRVAANLNVCIFWFHPLAWWLERELARLAEEAADDAALCEIEDREEYAATLLDIAQAAAVDGRVLNWRVISMAAGSNVVRRVNRILDRRISIPKPLGRAVWTALFACGVPVIYLSAAVKLAPHRESIPLKRAALPTQPDEGVRNPPHRLLAQVAPNPSPESIAPLPKDQPLTMCILVDNSGSMSDKRAEVKAAALALVKASQPGDEICIVDFNDEAYNGLPNGKDFTGDIKEMEAALAQIDSRGGTAMRDAIRMVVGQMEQTAHNSRKAVVLVTGGDDTSSAIGQDQLLGELKSSNVRIYGIGLVGKGGQTQEGARLELHQLVEASGGLDYYPRDLAELDHMSSELAHEIRKR